MIRREENLTTQLLIVVSPIVSAAFLLTLVLLWS